MLENLKTTLYNEIYIYLNYLFKKIELILNIKFDLIFDFFSLFLFSKNNEYFLVSCLFWVIFIYYVFFWTKRSFFLIVDFNIYTIIFLKFKTNITHKALPKIGYLLNFQIFNKIIWKPIFKKTSYTGFFFSQQNKWH